MVTGEDQKSAMQRRQGEQNVTFKPDRVPPRAQRATAAQPHFIFAHHILSPFTVADPFYHQLLYSYIADKQLRPGSGHIPHAALQYYFFFFFTNATID